MSFMLKSYEVVGWVGAFKDLETAQVLGFLWDSDFELGLVNFFPMIQISQKKRSYMHKSLNKLKIETTKHSCKSYKDTLPLGIFNTTESFPSHSSSVVDSIV